MESAVAAHGDRALPLPRRRERPAVGIHTLGAAHPAVTRLNIPTAAVVDGGGGGEGGGVEVVGDSAEGAGPSGGSGAAAAAGDNGTQGEEARASKEKTFAALATALGSKDPVLIASLTRSLPAAVVEELVRGEEARQSQPAVAVDATKAVKLVVAPKLFKSRMRVAAAWPKYRRENGGGATSTRRGTSVNFMVERLDWSEP